MIAKCRFTIEIFGIKNIKIYSYRYGKNALYSIFLHQKTGVFFLLLRNKKYSLDLSLFWLLYHKHVDIGYHWQNNRNFRVIIECQNVCFMKFGAFEPALLLTPDIFYLFCNKLAWTQKWYISLLVLEYCCSSWTCIFSNLHNYIWLSFEWVK